MRDVKKEKILKYSVSKNYIVVSVIVMIVSLIGYFLLLYYDNQFSIEILTNSITHNLSSNEIKEYKNYINWLNVGEGFLMLFLSVSATSILGLLLKINENNNIYSELITNDIFASKDFYNTLSEENREQMLNNLESRMLFNDSKTKSDMYTYIRKSLNDSLEDGYYYKSCKYDIRCTIYKDYIEKSILKTVKLLPINNAFTLKKFLVAASRHTTITGKDAFTFKGLKVDGKSVDNKYIEKKSAPVLDFDKKNGYTENIEVKCTRQINLSPKNAHEISIEYITIVPISDLSYSCRLKHACKNYSFSFRLTDKTNKNYRLQASAYGFVDDASKTPNQLDDKNSVNIEFNGWMFPSDGVSIIIKEDR